MNHIEEAIAKTQLKGERDVGRNQARGIAYLDDRILGYLGLIVFLGLAVIWITADSDWIVYGSLGLAIFLIVLWGIARIRRIDRVRRERAAQVRAVLRQSSDVDD